MTWICPKCERTLKNANQSHCCIKQDFDSLFKNKPVELEYAFDKLLSYIIDWGEVEISATKNCIVFLSTQTFLVVKPMKQVLNIKFYLAAPFEQFPVFKVALYGKQYEHHVRVSQIDEIDDYLVALIKKSYNLFRK